MMTHSDFYPPPLTIKSRPGHCNSQHDPAGLFKGSGRVTVAWQCPASSASVSATHCCCIDPQTTGAPHCSHPAGTMLLTHCQ